MVISREAAEIIRVARKASRLTVPAAAAKAGIARSRWEHIEAGRERRLGRDVPVRIKPETLAKVAWAVSIKPEAHDLAGEPFGSPEAARILAEITRREARPADEIPGPVRRLAARDYLDPESLWAMKSVRDMWALASLSEDERWGMILQILDDIRDNGGSAESTTRRRALQVSGFPHLRTASAAVAHPAGAPRQHRRRPAQGPVPAGTAAAR